MKKQTIKRQLYSVTAQNDCQVTATIDGTIYTLLDLKAGEQKTFVAIADEVEISDEKAIILPFESAPAIIEKVAQSGGESVATGGGTSTTFSWYLNSNFFGKAVIVIEESAPTGYYTFDFTELIQTIGNDKWSDLTFTRRCYGQFEGNNQTYDKENFSDNWIQPTLYHEQGKVSPIIQITNSKTNEWGGKSFCLNDTCYAPGEMVMTGIGIYSTEIPIRERISIESLETDFWP